MVLRANALPYGAMNRCVPLNVRFPQRNRDLLTMTLGHGLLHCMAGAGKVMQTRIAWQEPANDFNANTSVSRLCSQREGEQLTLCGAPISVADTEQCWPCIA